MESTQLSAFFQSVTTWPENASELSVVADKISQLLGAPLVAIHRPGPPPLTSWKLEGAHERVSADAIEEFVRFKIRHAESLFAGVTGAGATLKQLQIGGDQRPWRTDAAITHLAFINISGENRPSVSGGRGGKSRVDYGWLVVGSPKALSTKEEILCLAVAQRLAALAEAHALEGAIQLRNQFLSIASHELKTPLTSIYGVLQLQERMLRLKKDEPVHQAQERQESYLKMTIRQTQRLNELIDGLLDVSRIQNGRFMAEPSDTDVSSLVKETIAGRLSVIAHEAGVRLSIEGPESLKAWVDPVRMEEVVTNLVMNAIRFSPEGGVVWIRLREGDGLMHMTVRDQGPHVPAEDRERIFQPFERAQRTARFGGLGLGLFISRQIAQIHGGDVVLAESLPGRGNSFEATFPRRANSQLSA